MTAALNKSHAILFLILIFFFKLSHCVLSNTIFCPQIERKSLLDFKQSLADPSNALSSWGSEVNCCKWEGVVCDNLAGHVHQLHLQLNRLSGEINPSLLNLTHLSYLDLSLNRFEQTIPSFFGSFTNLEYLNLASAGFYGKIPHTIGNLSNLHTLDLESQKHFGNNLEPARSDDINHWSPLNADGLEWLSGLSKLEYLNMDGANLSKATNWPKVINTLPSLLHLHFQECDLQFVASLDDVNTTSLRSLDLSRNNNYRSSPVLTWIFQFSNLIFLDIRFNHFQGPIPRISNITQLQYIDLRNNEFSSSIPDWLFLCTNLEFVYLSGNRLSGEIPREIGNFKALKELTLDENHFSGELPDEFGELRSLQILMLSGNSFSGAIPIGLGKLESLKKLNDE